MYSKLLIATDTESMALYEPADSLVEAERALQLYEQHSGYGQWKVVFPGSLVLSERVCAVFGLPPADGPVGLETMVKLYHPDDRGKFLTLIAQTLEGRRGFHCRLRVVTPEGVVRMVETVADLRINNGRVVELFGASRDVTADMDRELAVHGRLKLMQDMIAEMPAPVAVTDEHLRVVDCSIYWLKAHRLLERRDVVGKTLAQLHSLTPEMSAEHQAALKGQTIKTRRSFISPTTNAPVQFNAVVRPWYLTERKVGGIMIAIGWSEIAVTRGQQAPEQADDFDGSLLDMLKTVV